MKNYFPLGYKNKHNESLKDLFLILKMVAIPIKFVVVIVLAVACCHCQSEKIGSDSSTWEKLQISPDTFSSVEYANFLIEIYEHTDNNKATTTMSQKKYFYSPLAILDHKSAVSLYNNVTNQSEMRFRIEMWNDKVQNEVVKHLNEIVGHEIKSNQIRVIPSKKIILTSDVPTAGEYSISSPWTNYDKRKILRLSLTCDRFGGGERRKRHGFNVGEIHGTATGNLFFLIHGNGGSSSFIFCLFRSKNLFERGSNREEFS